MRSTGTRSSEPTVPASFVSCPVAVLRRKAATASLAFDAYSLKVIAPVELAAEP
jgi:hypothetical protein